MIITEVFTMQLLAKTEEIKSCLNACKPVSEVGSLTWAQGTKNDFSEAMETNQVSPHSTSN